MSQEDTLVGGQNETEPYAAQPASDATLKISKTGQMRLTGRWLTIARVVWVVMLAVNVAAGVIGFPLAYAQSHIVCDPATDPASGANNDQRVPVDLAKQLPQGGSSLEFRSEE